jgi:phosphoglucosamine mutase
MEEMLKHGYVVGGEQSGHVILAEHLFTGDGMATALAVMRVMVGSRVSWRIWPVSCTSQALVTIACVSGDVATVPSPTMARVRAALEDRPPAGAVLGHRAPAAHHDRG